MRLFISILAIAALAIGIAISTHADINEGGRCGLDI